MSSNKRVRFLGFACFVLFLAAVPILLTAAAEAGGKTKTQTYVGRFQAKVVPESARIAVVTNGTTLMAYICSVDEDFNANVSQWFQGDVKDGAFKVTAKGATLEGTIQGNDIKGRLKDEGQELAFTATAVPGDSLSGLYRAEDADATGTPVVAGWIVDMGDKVEPIGCVSGAVGNGKQPPGTPPAADPQRLAGKGGNPNLKVNDPTKGGGKGTGVALNAEAAARLRAARLARLAADPRGGALLDMVQTGMRRFLAGATPDGPVEKKMFAIFAKAKKKNLQNMVARLDASSAKTKQTILGGGVLKLSPKTPINESVLKALAGRIGVKPVGKVSTPTSKTPGTVQAVSIPTLKCNKQQSDGPFGLGGANEIFAVYTIVLGDKTVTRTTATLPNVTDGTTKPFSATDAQVFPGELVPQAGQDVLIVASLFEEDDLGIITDIIDGVSTVLQTISTIAQATDAFDFAEGDTFKKVSLVVQILGLVSDGLLALLPDGTDSLGSDAILFTSTGQQLGDNGKAKTKFAFRKTNNKGKTEFDFELPTVKAQVK